METIERPMRPFRGVCILVAVGALAALLAGAGLSSGLASADQHGRQPKDVPPPPASTPVLTLRGEGDVSVVNMVYEPGQTSGWHAHEGIHAVAVLSGTLTVYDEWCERRTYSPGNPYIGGQRWHLAQNETEAPVEMVVTYLNPGVKSTHAAPPPPRPCDAI